MSTRSGKRIHSSFREVNTDAEITRSERKTRSKHSKENVDVINASSKVKTRHYVAYPSSDETAAEDGTNDKKKARVHRKNAPREHNLPSSTEPAEPDTRKSVRSTRKTHRFAENPEDPSIHPHDEFKPKKRKNVEKKVVPKKKSKKKKGRGSGSIVVEDIVPEAASTLNKSYISVDSFHSAAGSPMNTVIDEPSNIVGPVLMMDTIFTQKNNTLELIETGSAGNLDSTLTNDATDQGSRRKSSVKANSSAKSNKGSLNNMPSNFKICKSSIKDTEESKNSTFDVESNLNSSTRKSLKNATFDKTLTPEKVETTVEIHDKVKTKLSTDEMFDVIDDLKLVKKISGNTTFEMEASTKPDKRSRRQSAVKAKLKMSEKSSPLSVTVINSKPKFTLNNVSLRQSIATTSDKDSDTEFVEDKKSTVNVNLDVASSVSSANEILPIKMDENESVIITTYDEVTDHQTNVNTTLDNEFTKTNNTTFDQETSGTKTKNMRKSLPLLPIQKLSDPNVNNDLEKKLVNTYDKNSKSSIISSDNSIISLDKSNVSQISITSDESQNDQNLLSITPVLIESSLDESQISHYKTPPKTDTISPVTPLKREATFTKDESSATSVDVLKISSDKNPQQPNCNASMTPLKREGTFTKDKPEANLKTPTKQLSLSLPSPGLTPFHVDRSTTKERKSVLMNVTRSIEKSQPLLAKPSRATKVMFCSPVNNPALVLQNERKVVKSNMKGSNKSFVFDRSFALDSKPVNRKRSYTQSDAEDARVKRKRLADGTQQSVERLSRQHTSSASAKLAEPTTPKKLATPRKTDVKPARTKLPNFVALHQKQFDKMESLNECQSRRARRAKQLLTSTGGVDMLQRISPKDKSELENPKEPSKPSKDTKKPETPIKSLPPLKSLNSGYTRFGFKLNLDVNPFSISNKTQTQPKEKKPNGPETKDIIRSKKSLPSLSGATSRKEIAKQTVMREKSFTDRRNLKRIENLTENRTVIKGVRTNRRFELQMRMRDI